MVLPLHTSDAWPVKDCIAAGWGREASSKMKSVLASLAKGESTFAPDRSWDALLVRLFPEVARLWVAEPGQVAKTALTTTKQGNPPAH